MSVSLPESMSFGLLSRLPPQSFEFSWVQIDPDIFPSGGYYDMTQTNRPTIHIRGAPNEFALNTGMYVGGDLENQYNVLATAAGGNFTLAQYNTSYSAGKFTADVKYGPSWFRSSRESFNSSALPFLDNQDSNRHAAINQYRGRASRRAVGDDMVTIEGLEAANFRSNSSLYREANRVRTVVDQNTVSVWTSAGYSNVRVVNTGAVGTTNVVAGDNTLKFSIPIGMYSCLANAHSVLPIGLMSAYSVNGYSIEFETELANEYAANQANHTRGFLDWTGKSWAAGETSTDAGAGAVGAANLRLVSSRMRGLRIYVPIVKVLDPAVMEAVLSLYEKRETVNLGGVMFPMSLRLNSIGFRQFTYPIQLNNQADYYFRLPSTDKSVRAVYWFMNGKRNFDYNFGLPIGNKTSLTRLETKVGSLRPHPVVENNHPSDDNIEKFIHSNLKKSAYLFSPFPQYLENQVRGGTAEDRLVPFRSQLSPFPLTFVDGAGGVGPTAATTVTNSLFYGCVSFENMDHREPDYATSYQASGYDLTNRGGIDMWLRIKTVTSEPADASAAVAVPSTIAYDVPAAADLPAQGAEIVFLLAYDNILEISPQGVTDITNSTL